MKLFIILFLTTLLSANTLHAVTFEELTEQLNYLSMKDMVISKNIANANTPNYLPKKVEKPIDTSRLSLDLTNNLHIPFESVTAISLSEAEVLELKPNGNGVTVEAELAKKSENSLELKELANLFHKSKSMLQTALSGGNK
ncbi:MAG: flagellar basal body rod protein FlgB [Candidatus Midichloria sp.]|uniref:Flagellar basal body rod protein FlgB n=1 Tax=Hyalomma marginatum TaxID=34627 RepID=A0A8S4C1S9_9ACAR|nr:flagellar basal body rod protein FlgB [Hyalomma marginatum]CAG7597647.1 flagellar basal body rod protein FlgB [Hyalomma marginatum]